MCFARSSRAKAERGKRRREEGLRAALDSPKKVGAAHVRETDPAPTSGARAPVAELADAHRVQPCGQSGRPSPSRGWVTTFNRGCDSNTECQRNEKRREKTRPA